MGTHKRPNNNNNSYSSSDLKNWNKIFNTMVHMLQTQQTQLQFLAKERKLLDDRIKSIHQRWISDVNLFQDQISQMKREFDMQEMAQRVEEGKWDLMMGSKQREAFMCKVKLDNADSQLADFRQWFDILCQKLPEPKDTSKTAHSKGKEHQCNALESELKRLKDENDKLISKNNPEISALLSEGNFVWNQYNMMANNLTNQLRSTRADVDRANEKIQKLQSNMEQLKVSNTEKDNTVVALKNKLSKLEANLIKKNDKISRLSGELESLRKSRNDTTSPVLRKCIAQPGHYHFGSKNRGTDGKVITNKESHDSQVSEKGSRNSKRKAEDSILTSSEPPKLFSSAFKPPKLKKKLSSPVI